MSHQCLVVRTRTPYTRTLKRRGSIKCHQGLVVRTIKTCIISRTFKNHQTCPHCFWQRTLQNIERERWGFYINILNYYEKPTWCQVLLGYVPHLLHLACLVPYGGRLFTPKVGNLNFYFHFVHGLSDTSGRNNNFISICDFGLAGNPLLKIKSVWPSGIFGEGPLSYHPYRYYFISESVRSLDPYWPSWPLGISI
jgi:hypothetical protein